MPHPFRPVRLILAGITLAALIGGVLALGAGPLSQAGVDEAEARARHVEIDSVELLDAASKPVAWGALKGRPRALFFGFTHCAVICPVTMYELLKAVEDLGPTADGIDVQFVSIDPERDTPKRLGEYFSGFGPRIHAFTGSAEAIARIAGSYQVTYHRMADPHGEYAMSHTTTIFLLDRLGRISDVLAYDSPRGLIRQRLRALAGA